MGIEPASVLRVFFCSAPISPFAENIVTAYIFDPKSFRTFGNLPATALQLSVEQVVSALRADTIVLVECPLAKARLSEAVRKEEKFLPSCKASDVRLKPGDTIYLVRSELEGLRCFTWKLT